MAKGAKAFDRRARELGLDRPIPRRDFLNGLAVAYLGSAFSPFDSEAAGMFEWLNRGAPPPNPHYPPALTGLRGSHDGSWEVAHALARDGKSWRRPLLQTDETYDLVVVGGGISGLAAAWFFRERSGSSSKILILDNHDDFGGHAKRNEFRVGGRLLIGYGGSQSIQDPGEWSGEAMGLLRSLGIDVEKFKVAFDESVYEGLGWGTWFDRETFGEDRLVVTQGEEDNAAYERAPVSEQAYLELRRLQREPGDYLLGLTNEEKISRLKRVSYRTFLLEDAKVSEEVARVFQKRPHGMFGVGTDAVSALDCYYMEFPGFGGLNLDLSAAVAPKWKDHEPYIYHFPDGNAGIARMIVRSLIPRALTGVTMEDAVTTPVNYGLLDEERSPVRIRLNSTAVRVEHVKNGSAVDITYVRAGEAKRVRARQAVLACYNQIIPFLCPELPADQKEALRYGVKVPLVYANVAIRNWTSFRSLGIRGAYCPGAYHHSVSLDFPVSLGDYRCSQSPDEPMVLHLVRTPCRPNEGLTAREQHKLGRTELLETSFATFEEKIRDQLGRMLTDGGFDPARDIEAITVNRWPHGYAYEPTTLFDPDWPPGRAPWEIGRKPFGHVAIANSDAGASAYAHSAIDQAWRAVEELFGAGRP